MRALLQVSKVLMALVGGLALVFNVGAIISFLGFIGISHIPRSEFIDIVRELVALDRFWFYFGAGAVLDVALLFWFFTGCFCDFKELTQDTLWFNLVFGSFSLLFVLLPMIALKVPVKLVLLTIVIPIIFIASSGILYVKEVKSNG